MEDIKAQASLVLKLPYLFSHNKVVIPEVIGFLYVLFMSFRCMIMMMLYLKSTLERVPVL